MKLIEISKSVLGNQEVNSVNARELHEFLEVGRDFTTWVKGRIAQYGFVEGEDYIIIEKLSSPKLGSANINHVDHNMARPQTLKDYLISIDMAKELAMVERNEKGKQARQYFIECERQLKQQFPTLPNFNNPAAAARAWALEYERAEALRLENLKKEQALLVAKPKVEVYDQIVERNHLYNATQVAQKMKMSAVKMNRHLDEMKVYSKSVKRSRAFRQWFIDEGLGIMRETETGHSQPMFTAQGEMWIVSTFASEGLI